MCGVVGPGGSHTLNNNLNCRADNPLTVISTSAEPTILDLNGRRVTCVPENNDGIGIRIIGEGAEVRNGRVRRCGDTGVKLEPDEVTLVGGNNLVEDIEVSDSTDCFDANTGGNTFRHNTAMGCGRVMT